MTKLLNVSADFLKRARQQQLTQRKTFMAESSPLFRFTRIIFLIFTVFFMSAAETDAAVIQLVSGKIIEGDIIARDEESIKVDTGIGIPITYYLDEIESIDGDLLRVEEVNEAEEIKTHELIEAGEGIQVLEPISFTEDIRMEEPAKKAIPVKDIKIIEQQNRAKEAPSPFGPKLNKRPQEQTTDKLDPGRSAVHHLMREVDKNLGAGNAGPAKTESSGAAQNSLFRLFHEFFEQQAGNLSESMSRARQKIPMLSEKLEQIPMKIRRDILFVSSLFCSIIYVLISFPLMKIAQKFNERHIWLAWVPMIQIFYLNHLAKGPASWYFYLLLPVVNVFILIYIFIVILRALHKPAWLSLLIIVPGINIFMLWYLALTKAGREAG